MGFSLFTYLTIFLSNDSITTNYNRFDFFSLLHRLKYFYAVRKMGLFIACREKNHNIFLYRSISIQCNSFKWHLKSGGIIGFHTTSNMCQCILIMHINLLRFFTLLQIWKFFVNFCDQLVERKSFDYVKKWLRIFVWKSKKESNFCSITYLIQEVYCDQWIASFEIK